MYRNMNSKQQSFAAWNEQRQRKDDPTTEANSNFTIWSQVTNIQDSFVNQMQDLYGILPDAGPLSSEFRGRLLNAVYLLIGSIFFALLTIFIGIPTLLLRPSKFVLCLTISTILAASSVIVLQKPSIFISNLFSGGLSQSGPVVLLFCSVFFTFYVTVFYHRYVLTLVAGGIQIFCLAIYLATFIPGGMTGLQLVWRMLWTIISATLTPCLYVMKQTLCALYRTAFS